MTRPKLLKSFAHRLVIRLQVDLIGEPILPTAQIVILVFVGWRARVPRAQLALVCALLLRVHPLIVLSVALAVRVALAVVSRRLPKGYDARIARSTRRVITTPECPPLTPSEPIDTSADVRYPQPRLKSC